MNKKIAIMQPTYIPWLGYLSMIEKSDVFVFLDNVQFDHRSWQHRNRIKSSAGEIWLSIPVKTKGLQQQNICDVECIDFSKTINKHLKSIKHNYSQAQNFKEFYTYFENCVQSSFLESDNTLSLFTMSIIKGLCNYADIKTEFLLSSRLKASGKKDELLANICKECNFNDYLSAVGSRNYLNDSPYFQENNIEIYYHEYIHPTYTQLYGNFIEGMSCLDAFFNVERDDLKTLIMSGCL